MRQRIKDLDVIRGYAIFGILVCNIVLFHYPLEYMFRYFGSHNSWLNEILEFIRFSYFADRTFTLFSLLFGIGIGMQYSKFQKTGKSFTIYHLVRMMLLLIIGLFHAVFIWYGDILAMYAVLGIVSLLIINLSAKRLFVISVILYIIPTLLTVMMRNDILTISLHSSIIKSLEDLIAQNTLEGIYGHVNYNLSQLLSIVEFYITGNMYSSFSMIVFGLSIAKLELHKKIDSKPKVYHNLFIYSTPIILIWTIYKLFFFDPTSMRSDLNFYIYWLLFNLSILAHTFFVIAILVKLNRSNWLTKITDGLGYLGRMSLTNYLLHSVAGIIIFKLCGLYGNSSPTLDMVIAIFLTIAQIYLSRFWLNRYGIGPIEYIWRKSAKFFVAN